MKAATFAAVAFLMCTRCGFGVPQTISYQGRISVGSVNFEGTGQFKFALVSGGGGTTYWSNDGTSTGGGQPTNAVSLAVSKGLYSLLLGDTGLANMTPIPEAVFTNNDVRLRVWFNDSINGWQMLSPDQKLGSTGFSMMAASVPDGAITTAKLADSSVTTDKLADGGVSGNKIAAGAVDGNKVQNGSLGANHLVNSAIGTLQLADAAVTTAKLEGGSVDGSKIAALAVGSGHLATGSVGTAQLASNAVTTIKIAAGAVDGSKITAGSIGAGHLVNGAVGTLQIADGAVTQAKLANAAVGTVQIGNGVITQAKLGPGVGPNLPFAASVTIDTEQASSGFAISNAGTSPAVQFQATGAGSALQVETISASGFGGLVARSSGSGYAGLFVDSGGTKASNVPLVGIIGSSAMFAPSLYVQTAGSGNAISALHSGTGSSGSALRVIGASASADAVAHVTTNGVASAATFVDNRNVSPDPPGAVEIYGRIGSALEVFHESQARPAVRIESINLGAAASMLFPVLEVDTTPANATNGGFAAWFHGRVYMDPTGPDTDDPTLRVVGFPHENPPGVFRYGKSSLLLGDVEISGNLNLTNNGATSPHLGIGTLVGTGSINALEVEGNAAKTGGGNWSVLSDRRVKQDIEPIRSALATLNRVRLVSFRYTAEERSRHPSLKDQRFYNVIAQEFAEVFPDFVVPSGETMPDGSPVLQVDTSPLSIYSAAAIQELHLLLKEKSEEVHALESRMAAQEQRLARLEELLSQSNRIPKTGSKPASKGAGR